MVSEGDIQTVQAKVARFVQQGKPVPQGLATCLAGYLARRQRQYLRVLKNRRQRGELR